MMNYIKNIILYGEICRWNLDMVFNPFLCNFFRKGPMKLEISSLTIIVSSILFVFLNTHTKSYYDS